MTPQEVRSQVMFIVAAYAAQVERMLDAWLADQSAAGFKNTEEQVAALGRQLSDGVTSVVLKAIVEDSVFQASTVKAAKMGSPRKLRSGARRLVLVILLGGSTVALTVPYLKPDRRGKRPGRKRKPGRRGEGGVGLYPPLSALGIWFGVTPATASEICQQVASSESVRSARQALERRDLDLGHKQTLRIVNLVGTRLVEQRNTWLTQVRDGGPIEGGLVKGKRVVVAVDGGRIRIRIPKISGRKRKSGHRGFDAPWSEPKLLTIYVIDKDGNMADTFKPIIDGTMGDSDALFAMLSAYLKALGVHEAEALVMLGDGAEWIWNRVGALVAAVGIDPSRVHEILDVYHAVEKLGTIAAIPRWARQERKTWLRRAERLLKDGKIEKLIDHIRTLAKGRRAKGIKAHIGYFGANRGRMRYATFRAGKLPLGSGAIESVVRRVVNMKLKGNAKFWLIDNAEHTLLLRSYLKAGRFSDLFGWSLAQAAPWWDDGTYPTPLGALGPLTVGQEAYEAAA